MKKKYRAPDMTVVEMKAQKFLCGSITVNDLNLNVNLGGDEGDFGDDDIIN